MWEEETIAPLFSNIPIQSFTTKAHELYDFTVDQIIISSKKSIAIEYLSEEDIKQSGQFGLETLGNLEQFNLFIKKIKKNREEFHQFVTHFINLNLKKLSNEQLLDLFEKYFSQVTELITWYSLTEPEKLGKIEGIVEVFVDQEIKEKEKKLEAFLLITKPLAKLEFNPKIDLLLKSFTEHYAGHYELNKTLNQSQWLVEKKETPGQKKKREELIQKLNPPQKIKDYIKVLQTTSVERFKTRLYWMEGVYYFDYILEEIASRTGFSRPQLKNYKYEEIFDLVKNNQFVEPSLLEERNNHFIIYSLSGKTGFLTGRSAQEFLDRKIKPTIITKEIKGQCASMGKVKGKVRVISFAQCELHSAKVREMQQGEIIVTQMTRPNIILACEKAGAIITDEGGLTCHAAIVSRELGIPCIVGTKNATQILKDGDLVEVNADEGTVKIIQRKS